MSTVAFSACLAVVLAGDYNAASAQFLHAEGIAAELDGDYETALERLRRANQTLVGDAMIEFDLARVALLRGGTEADLEPFWRNADRSAAVEPLRTAIAHKLGRDVPGKTQIWSPPPWIAATVRTGVEYDTNVSILPDDGPSHLTGVRYTVDGSVLYRPLRRALAVDTGVQFRLGKYLNADGDELARFDATTIVLLAGLRYQAESWRFTLVLDGVETLTDGVSNLYLRAANADADMRFVLGAGHLGVYAKARIQDFIDFNSEGSAYDRDGSQLGAGLSWDWEGSEAFTLRGRLGWMQQSADGMRQEVRAAQLSIVGRLTLGRVSGALGAVNELRLYRDVVFQDLVDRDNPARIDNRTMPFAKVHVDIWQWIGAYASYVLTYNLSTTSGDLDSSEDFGYRRHVAQVGIEGRL